jgi:hypothetical protein
MWQSWEPACEYMPEFQPMDKVTSPGPDFLWPSHFQVGFGPPLHPPRGSSTKSEV